MRSNPYRITLLTIAILGAILGFLLVVRGLTPPPEYEGDFPDPLRDLPIIIWGAGILNLALVSLLLWLHSSAIAWASENPSPPIDEKPEP